VINAKAVIMATGGHEALYSFRSTTPRATGDGIAMALRVGSEVMDVEFMQFNPYTMIYPKGASGVLVPMNAYIMTRGGKYRNKSGEPFVDRWDPVRKEATTRDVKARAMFTEMIENRGSKHGGVYLDLGGLEDLDGKSPEEVLAIQGGMHQAYLNQFGVDILRDKLEVAPAAHFGVGGIRINEKAETNISGLYAAGEVSGGLHGANRLDAASMPEIFVFGSIAGEEASSYSSQINAETPDQDMIKNIKENVIDFLNNANGETRVAEAKKQLEEVMFSCFGLVRDGDTMGKGLESIMDMKQNTIPGLLIKDKNLIGNYDWLEALEYVNMLDVAEAMAVSAVGRKESRSTHYRTDYPEMEEQFTKNTIVRRAKGKLEVYSEEVVREESQP